MKALENTLPIYVHYSISKLNQAYEAVGIDLPQYETVDFRLPVQHVNQKIVIVPPALVDSNALKKIQNMAYAYCSGWMHVRVARRWRSADAGFAISDHADWNVLLYVIKVPEVQKVYVTHVQTEFFST